MCNNAAVYVQIGTVEYVQCNAVTYIKCIAVGYEQCNFSRVCIVNALEYV